MHLFSNWAKRRNKGLQMVQAVVSVYLIQMCPAWWIQPDGIYSKICAWGIPNTHVIGILSYTALLIRNTKENRVDVCCFLTARYTFLPSKQLPACILKNYFSLTVGAWWDRKSRMQLRKTKGFLEPSPTSWQILPLQLWEGECFGFSIAVKQTTTILEV